MKIEFDSDSLEDMKLVRAMLGKRIREREVEYEERRKIYERYDKLSSFHNVAVPNVPTDSPAIAWSKLSRKPDNGGDIAKKKKKGVTS